MTLFERTIVCFCDLSLIIIATVKCYSDKNATCNRHRLGKDQAREALLTLSVPQPFCQNLIIQVKPMKGIKVDMGLMVISDFFSGSIAD